MDEQDNPVVKFIAQVAGQIFERIIRGQIEYESDLKALQKYREMAKQANAPRREANIVNYIAILNSVSGHLSLANEQFTQLYDLHNAMNSREGIVVALNNKAFFLISLGKYVEASDVYTQAITLAEKGIEEVILIYSQTLSGKLFIHYTLKQFELMPDVFEKISKIEESILTRSAKEYARIMTEVNRSMAEYHLHHQNYAQAQSLIRTGIDFATGLGLTFELADLYYAQAHIALALGDNKEADVLWSKAIDLLKNVPAQSTVGRNYNQEARYLESRGYMEYGRRFAKYAYDIFESLNMPEDIQLTQVLL